jgi:hypothetical protein
MPGPDPIWTPALVLRGLRLAYAAQPRFDEASTSAQPPASYSYIADHARELLGTDSHDWAALVLRVAPAPGLSIREMCRERYGWHHSRSELYRRSNRGAVRVAAALERDGVPIPGGLQTGPPS